MGDNTRPTAKAVNPESRSDSIVVSFKSHYYKDILNKSFTAVIRKRVPTNIHPKRLYFHVNSPESAICARAKIKFTANINLEKAIKISKELNLSEETIRNYIGKHVSIGCYYLGDFDFPEKEVSIVELNANLIYFAPQSFFILSKEGKKILNRLCGFR